MHAPSGRPREFTHPKRRELIDHIGQGATVEEAARIVGVSLRTAQRADRHDAAGDAEHPTPSRLPLCPFCERRLLNPPRQEVQESEFSC